MVVIMYPFMSFIAAIIYYNNHGGFYLWTLLAEWLKLKRCNSLFAFFMQLFSIQPFVRKVFKLLFTKDIKSRNVDKKVTAE